MLAELECSYVGTVEIQTLRQLHSNSVNIDVVMLAELECGCMSLNYYD